MEALLDLTLTYEKNRALLKIAGMITTENAQLLHEKFSEVLQSGVNSLDIDFSLCRIICSTGIGKLMMFSKEFTPKGGKVQIVKCSTNVYDLFTTIKLDQIMPITQ